jgi:hypothetical protein
VPPNDTDGIRRAVCELAEAIHNRENVVEPARLEQFTRENLTGVLARNLDALIGRPSDAVGYFTPEPLQEVER